MCTHAKGWIDAYKLVAHIVKYVQVPWLACTHLHSCIPIDLVLLGCAVTINCLECGRVNETQGLSYGQPRQLWCRRCHARLAVGAEQSKFVNHQPGVVIGKDGGGHCKALCEEIISCSLCLSLSYTHTAPSSLPLACSRLRQQRDPPLQEGKPLPECGTCLHYKKSHRWLR